MANNSTWKDRWVCIGGGTSGFGLRLAQQFARRGANVAIVGRDLIRGESAADSLRKQASGKIISFSVDLADEQAVERSEWKAWLQKIDLDVAIAAAGSSDRGFLMQLSSEELETMLRTNVYSSFCFSKATVEALKRSAGTLVHIASLSGIVAAPGMGAYSMAKHAVVAMSRQLRLELADCRVRVLLVCPGPIQGEPSTNGRYDDLIEKRNLPESLKKPAGGANLKSLDPEWLSKRIITAVEAGKRELVLPSKVRWLASFGGLWPRLLDFVLKRQREN